MRTYAARVAGPGPKRAAVAGLVGAVSATALLALLHTVWPRVGFPPEVIAQGFARALPGGVATFFIEHLGELALPLALIVTAAVFAGSGAVTGLLIARAPVRDGTAAATLWCTASLLPLWALTVVLYRPDAGDASAPLFALATLPAYGTGGFFASRTLAGLAEERAAGERDTARRRVLRSLVLGTAAVALGVVDLGRLLYRRPDPGLQPLRLADVERTAAPAASARDGDIAATAGLSDELTDNDRFYVVDEEIIDPDIDPATWRLRVHGAVRRPFTLTYDDLTAMPAVEQFQTLECISNPVGGPLISNAKWTGVPLGDLLEGAGVLPDARQIVFRQYEGAYSDGVTVAAAMDPRVLVAIGMNGRVLPREHGFPARLLLPGVYGMKMVKWLGEIEAVTVPEVGYWERRGWSSAAIVKTMSRIDTPKDRADLGPATEVAGVAFAGDRGISRVEVSPDGGASWRRADLRRPLGPLTWVLWRASLELPGAATTVLVRAYDGSGRLQTAAGARPHPDGASGYDSKSVTVER